MRISIVTLIVLFFIALPSKAQLRTYLGVETGQAWDINWVEDPANIFRRTMIPGNMHSITLKQEIIPNLGIETGISYHPYNSGINIRDHRPDNAGWKKADLILVPVRFSYRLQPTEFTWSITPRIGYQFGRILSSEAPMVHASVISDPDENTLEYNFVDNISTGSLHLLEFGVSGDHTFKNNWQLSLVLSHFSGFKEFSRSDITVAVSTGPPYNAEYSYDGTRFQASTRLSIPVSNFWENKDIRIRKTIEGSHGTGRGTIRPKNYIYFGGDVGALWRGFRTSNPAVGSRPIDGKGIFRYSNLHTGIYVGFLNMNNIGIDLGAYYQRSSLFFSLMYDHEVDLAVKTRAPMYLDIPLRVRYYYDVYKGKVLIVPSLGLSVLTHFSAGSYGTGSDSFSYLTTTGTGNGSASYSGQRSARIGLMLRAGIGGEYRVPIKFPLYAGLSLEYNHGLKKIDEIQVSTNIGEEPVNSTVNYLGSGWNLSLGVRIPVILGKENRKCGAM